IINKTVVYSNMLRYTPDATVLGSETFSVPVQCHFNRFHYSYKIGFVPSIERLKFFKPMKTKGSISLTACDAQWNRLPPSEAVVIGQPMYFEAETLYVPEDERLYVHFCHITTNSSRVSTPQVNIIYNYGCLMDSKRSNHSRFTSSTRRNVVRFIIDAFTLQGKVQKYMFIHCEMSIRSIIATQTSKLCSYNQLEHRWEELHGTDSVCSCCDSSCVPEMPTPMQPLTSKLGTLVEQDPEGTSGKNLGQSTEGIFTPKPEHEILITENLHKTIVPERRLTLEHEHRITLESTSESRSTVLTPESEHGEIAPETPPTPKGEHGEIAPETPPSELGSEPGAVAPKHEYGTLTPEGEHGEILPETPPTPRGEHGEHGEILPETPPTPGNEFVVPTLDTIQEKITPYTHEPLTPSDKNTMSSVDTHTQPLEPYKIFEEVFGLS
ncbi:zona pellucida sperm-binding protein 3d.2, partial [Tachysurus ichikawai]